MHLRQIWLNRTGNSPVSVTRSYVLRKDSRITVVQYCRSTWPYAMELTLLSSRNCDDVRDSVDTPVSCFSRARLRSLKARSRVKPRPSAVPALPWRVALSGGPTTLSTSSSRPRSTPGAERQDRRTFQPVQSVGVLTDAPDDQETAPEPSCAGSPALRLVAVRSHSWTRGPHRPTHYQFVITHAELLVAVADPFRCRCRCCSLCCRDEYILEISMGLVGPMGFPQEWESPSWFHGNENGNGNDLMGIIGNKNSTFSHFPPTGSWSPETVNPLLFLHSNPNLS